jgi:hypothetical protein
VDVPISRSTALATRDELFSTNETQETIGYVGVSVPMFLPELVPAVEVAAMADVVVDSVEGWDG